MRKISILQEIREVVSEDFLIIVNAPRSKIPRSAPYVNGTFMKVSQDKADGYTHRELQEIESALLWSEENFRYPQVNSLEGSGIETEPLDFSEEPAMDAGLYNLEFNTFRRLCFLCNRYFITSPHTSVFDLGWAFR